MPGSIDTWVPWGRAVAPSGSRRRKHLNAKHLNDSSGLVPLVPLGGPGV